VVNLPYGKGSSNPLKKWDLITRIGDTKIDDQGMVNLGNNLRVRFSTSFRSWPRMEKSRSR